MSPADPAPGGTALFLLADHSLCLLPHPDLAGLLQRWLPLLPYPPGRVPAGARVLRVDPAAGTPPARPAGAPSLRLGSVDCWVDGAAGTLELRGAAGSWGAARLAAGAGELRVPAGAGGELAALEWDLYSMCTLACALLLSRMHRALVHSAAVVAPGGGAWLLAGDAFAGKSTTSVNLITAGWRFVSDDHVILQRRGDGSLELEGWPRRFHLDEGWSAGAPGKPRGEVDPHARWPGSWQRSAPLAGVLLPRVEAGLPTSLEPVPAGEALAALVRQSPWLLADRGCAPEVLELLGDACRLPARSLRLGLDVYRDTGRLLQVLAPLWHSS